MKELHCREVGFDCEGVIRAETEEELLSEVAQHAQTKHGVAQLDEKTMEQIRSKIRST